MSAGISHAVVWREGDDLVVTWRGGDPASTSVFVSDHPDDPGVDVRAPDGPGRAVVAGVGRRRVHVHLFDPVGGFVVVAERRLPFDGPSNLRDLGGYPVASGGATRWGRVFRADGLHELSAADHADLRSLGVDVVFDLRGGVEVEAAPDRLPPGVVRRHRPMTSDAAMARTMQERIASGELSSFGPDDMVAGYLRILENFSATVAEVVEAVAGGRRVVVHCTAGKDRTGVTAMVLLGLAGVADGHVLDDYELTNRFRPVARAEAFERLVRARGLDPADFETLWSAPRSVMRRTLAGLRERWGDVDGYLAAAGLDGPTREAARAALVAPPGP